tara:strand:+ start:280 stop:3348 length:3069 start_codon:yes stop_codon:yes gene_type:complete
MSQNRLKLKELISGEKSKIFKTSKGVMVADFQEDYSNFNAITGTKSNRYGLRDISKGTLLKNIYFTDEFTRKSAVIKGDTNEKADIFSPDLTQNSVTQFKETAVSISDLTEKKVKYINYDKVKSSKVFMAGGNAIAIYPPSGNITENDSLTGSIEPRFIVTGLDFNYIEETPLNFDFFDYDSGVMYSNIMNAKNMYDEDYKTNVVVSGKTLVNHLTGNSLTLIDQLSAEVRNTRYYIDIGSDGNHLLYNVYRRGRDYEHDNREKSSAVVHSKSVNSDPYFRSWNTLANNTLGSTGNDALSAWVLSGGKRYDADGNGLGLGSSTATRVSAFVNEYKAKAGGDKNRPLHDNFNLFSSIILSGQSKIHIGHGTLKPGVTYNFRVDVAPFRLSGGTSPNPGALRSNGGKTITTTGVHEWQYTIPNSSVDPNSGRAFLSGNNSSSHAIVKSFLVSQGTISKIPVRAKTLKNSDFTSWSQVITGANVYGYNTSRNPDRGLDNSIDRYNKKPTDWITSGKINGFVKRNEQSSKSYDVTRSCINMAKSGFVEIKDANNILSADDKSYAVLIRFPDHLPLSVGDGLQATDDERMSIIGDLAGANGEDHIAIIPVGKSATNANETCKIQWRGGSSSTIEAGDESMDIRNDEFDGQWKWLVFRKKNSANTKKFAMSSKLSGFRFVTRTDSAIDLKTKNPGVGASTVSPYIQGRSSLSFSRYYEWTRELTDGETSGIIALGHIPSGALVGYNFEGINTTEIKNTIDQSTLLSSAQHHSNFIANQADSGVFTNVQTGITNAGGNGGNLVRVIDSSSDPTSTGNPASFGLFYNENMKIKTPMGGVRMFSRGNFGTGDKPTIIQKNAFPTSGLYDVSLTVSDFTSGLMSVFCGNSGIMKFTEPGVHRAKFNNNAETPASSSIKIVLSGGSKFSAPNTNNGYAEAVVESVNITKLDQQAGLYDLAERIDGFYRYQTIPLHKSNLFSIRINNSRLNIDDTLSEDEKVKIRKSVTNVVKDIVDKIKPVHTQLLNVEFTGE